MPRPRKCRWIEALPDVRYFKPQGVPLRFASETVLAVEGLEALRLADVEGLDQETAAERMKVSRPTFTRILAEARRAVAEALVNGWAIRVEGGHFVVAGEAEGEMPQGGGPGRGRRRRGRGNE